MGNSSASESDNPRFSFTSEDNATKVEIQNTDEESGKSQTIPSAIITDNVVKQESESSLEQSPPTKKLKHCEKEADKETSTLPAHALIVTVPPSPLADIILAYCDIETSLPPLRTDDKQATTSLPPLEMEEEQIEPNTSECIAPTELGEFPSHYHAENMLEELQEEIHDRAHELTESAINEHIIFDPNIQGYNIDQIKKLIREDMYNQNVDRPKKINEYELNRLKSMTEGMMEFLKSPKKGKKSEDSSLLQGTKVPKEKCQIQGIADRK
ncbi:hypothetical protein JTB14_008689 [Gonioctena quinquepunctata]|nr:hypothetical protein JTB14_008689 [Gonioctena quinquepunctata]